MSADVVPAPVSIRMALRVPAFLLVVTGRLPAAAAIALGRWRLSAHRAELALGFTDLFVFP